MVKPCYIRWPEELNNRLKLENRSYQRRALQVGGQGKCTHLNRENAGTGATRMPKEVLQEASIAERELVAERGRFRWRRPRGLLECRV